MKTENYLRKRQQSVRIALGGLGQAFQREPHMQVHLAAAIVALGFSLWLGLSEQQWFFIVLSIVLVMCAELFNSAIEKLCDKVEPNQDAAIGYIKDISAASVLLSCVFALICGLIIFVPLLLVKFF